MSGRVFGVLQGDTVPLPNLWVVFHQIGDGGGRVIDSVRTDVSGVYFLRSMARDTAAVYLSSVTYQDIGYFSRPVRFTEFTSDTASTLFVFDTSSVAPTVVLRQRHIVVRAPEPDGSRSVLELLVLENPGNLTRIANDTTQPVWQGAIPSGASNLEVAPSDVSPEAVYRRGDFVAMAAAVPPGAANQKQLVFGYMLPSGARRLNVPFDQPVDRVQILIEEEDVELLSGPVEHFGAEQIEAIRFQRFEGADILGGVEVSFRFARGATAVTGYLWMILAILGMAMLIAAALWLRRPELVSVDSEDVNSLAARVAALDEQFAATAESATDAERKAYEMRRADLKERLEHTLAREKPGG